MNDASMQDSLFPDPLGLRLRAGREQAGLTVEQVGAQLRLPVAIVEAMEREDWARLGAPVYVRSYVGSYLRLLGLPAALLELAGGTSAEPALVTLAPHSRMRHTVDRSLRNIVYLVMTAVLVVPVYFVARHYQASDRVQELTLDTDATRGPDAAPAIASDAPAPTAMPPSAAPSSVASSDPASGSAGLAAADTGPQPSGADAAPRAAAGPDPVMASMTPFAKPASPASLVLTFRGESWIDVVGPDGVRIERGLVPAGAERRYGPGEVARITLGNADGVAVEHAGRDIDLTPFRSANVARFAVSSDGAPAPAAN